MKYIFLNASQNRNGKTANLARQIFGNSRYTTINLVDFHIDQLGQKSRADQFMKVIKQIFHADIHSNLIESCKNLIGYRKSASKHEVIFVADLYIKNNCPVRMEF